MISPNNISLDSNADGDYCSLGFDISFFEQLDVLSLFSFLNIGHLNSVGFALVSFCVMALLFLASALISGSEVAYFSLMPQQLKQLEEEEDSKTKRIHQLLKQPDLLLATILIANNLVNISIVIFSFFITSHIFKQLGPEYISYGILTNTLVTTFLLVLLGEVMPKVYATHHNLRLAKFTATPLSLCYKLLYPFSHVLASSTSFIEKKLDHHRSNQDVNMNELNEAIDLVATTGNKENQKNLDMLKGLVELKDIAVNDIMCSRLDVFAIDYNLSFHLLCEEVVKMGYSRVPVYNDNLDNIAGILYVKDLLQYLEESDTFHWQKLIKEPFYVPETKKIDALLKEIQQRRNHLAIVVDEYGGTSGLITLEDILEEIVGDIKDEYDTTEVDFRKINRLHYEFAGKTMIHDVCKVMNIDRKTFEKVEGDFDSVAGLLLELEQKFPEEKSKIRFKRFIFTVLETDGNRIEKIRVTVRPSEVEKTI